MGTPTTLCFDDGRFTVLEEGDNSVVRFMFDLQPVHDLPRKDLSPGFLSWDGLQLSYHTATIGNETVIGVEIDGHSVDIKVWTKSANVGLCSMITHIQDISLQPMNTVMTPTPENITDFFKLIRKSSTSGAPSPSPSTPSMPSVPPSPFSQRPTTSNSVAESTTPKANRKRKSGDTLKEKASVNHNRKKKVRVVEKTADEIQHERMTVLSNKLEAQSTGMVHPKAEKIDVYQLQHDNTIRGIRKDFVNRLVKQMKDNLWMHDSVVFTINKVDNECFVIDGNHRLEALLIFLQDKVSKHPFKKVLCRVHDNLSLEQIYLLCKPSFTVHEHLKLTELQMVKLSVDYMKEKMIKQTSQKTIFVKKFNILMKSVIGEDYPVFATNIVLLHPRVHDALFEQEYKGIRMSEHCFSKRFWTTFLKAVGNNTDEALRILKNLKDNSVDEIEKQLKNVQLNLVKFLSTFGSTNWDSSSSAVTYFTGSNTTSPETVKRLLTSSKAIHNSKRSKKNADISWSDVKDKLQKWLSRKFKNTFYAGHSVDDFEGVNFILLIDPNESLLQLLEEAHKTAVIVLVSSDDSITPSIQGVEPTSTLKVVTSKPIFIDSPMDVIPKVYYEAALYVPDTPNDGKDEFLTSIAVKNSCKYASILDFDDLYIFGKYANEYKNSVVFFNSKTSSSILEGLRYYEKLSVMGNNKIQIFVEQLLASCGKSNSEEDEGAELKENQNPDLSDTEEYSNEDEN